MKKCPKCNKHYRDSQKFCSDCGLELIELSQEEQALVAEESQKAQSKKKGVIAIACILMLAIIAVCGVMMYPKLQVKNAIAELENELNRSVNVSECDVFTLPDGTKSSITMSYGSKYSLDGTYVVIAAGYLDTYFVKMDGLKVDYIYDYDIYASYTVTKQFNEIYLDIYEEYIDLIGTEKIKTIKV